MPDQQHPVEGPDADLTDGEEPEFPTGEEQAARNREEEPPA